MISPDQTIRRTFLQYEPSLDGIRAFAVIAVVFHHIYKPIFPGGWVGVDVFFVLSGYLITRLLAQECKASGRINLKAFYMRRVLRLMPAFLCLLVFCVAYTLILAEYPTPNLEAIAMAATYLMDWNCAFGWLPSWYLMHTWSLAVEEQFYLVWPFALAFLFKRKRPVLWIAAAIVLVIGWRNYLVLHGSPLERTYYGVDTHSDALLIGCALALIPVGISIRRWAHRLAIIPVVSAVLLVFRLQAQTQATQEYGITLSALVSMWLILAASQPGPFRQLLSLKPMVFTGRISYGWYLWHLPLLMIWNHAVPQGYGLVSVAAAYGVASASYFFIEKPCLRLKARFEPAVKCGRELVEPDLRELA